MRSPTIHKCANPVCGVEFRRLGEGKLFARPLDKPVAGKKQVTAWLCRQCYATHTMEFDETLQVFQLRHRRGHAA